MFDILLCKEYSAADSLKNIVDAKIYLCRATSGTLAAKYVGIFPGNYF